MVTADDSAVMKDDSKSMRAIAVVTLVFLPLATIAVSYLFHCPTEVIDLSIELFLGSE